MGKPILCLDFDGVEIQTLEQAMKIALVTTTINVPRVLPLYGAHNGSVAFFTIGDEKTPMAADETPLCYNYYNPERQNKLGYGCSELIGWNCIQRRNIGFLEAVRYGADIIVSIDDDNYPMDPFYFDNFHDLLVQPFNGLAVKPATWFNPGALCEPQIIQRGFPAEALPNCFSVRPVTDAPVGVAQGMIMGDADVWATARHSIFAARNRNRPTVVNPTELLRSGVVLKPTHQDWTVFNTQNTAFIRQLTPAMFCPPGLGRGDDIVAALVTQRVMRETGHFVHFGRPFAFQERNEHDGQADIAAESWIMRYVGEIARELDDLSIPEESIVDKVRAIYGNFLQFDWFPKPAIMAALAWCDDIEKVL